MPSSSSIDDVYTHTLWLLVAVADEGEARLVGVNGLDGSDVAWAAGQGKQIVAVRHEVNLTAALRDAGVPGYAA